MPASISADIPRYASEGWQSITDGDKGETQWAGCSFAAKHRVIS